MNVDHREMRTRFQDYQNSSRDGRWFDIVNAAGADDEPAEIRLYGEIGGWFGDISAKAFVAELDAITASEIVVSINSRGGDVFDGIAIYNALRQHPAHVTTKVDSMAASIASVVAQAGDRRVMVTASQMMIHEAWGLAIGTGDDLRETADVLDLQTDIIAGIYASRSGKDKADFAGLMAAETWMTDQETVDNGLADEMVEPPRKEKDPDNSAVSNTAKIKFTEQIAAVLTDVEKLTDRTEGVAAFRTEQGKPPLSDDSVEALSAVVARLSDVLTPAEPQDANDLAAVESEYVRFVAASLEEG